MKPRNMTGVLLILSVSAAHKEAIVFRAEPKTEVIRSIDIAANFSLVATLTVIDGQEQEHAPETEAIRFSRSVNCAVQDLFQLVDSQGQPRRLQRTIETHETIESVEIEGDQEGSHTDSSHGEMEGRSVLFEWNHENGKFDVSFVDGYAGDQELLVGLEEDMDLRILLPGEARSIGEKWKIQTDKDLLSMGGKLGLGYYLPVEADAVNQLASNRKTGITAILDHIDGDGRRVAAINLSVQSSSFSEWTHAGGDMQEFSKRLDESTSLTGVLRWDLDRCHPLSLSLGGKVSLEIKTQSEYEDDGRVCTLEDVDSFVGDVIAEMRMEYP